MATHLLSAPSSSGHEYHQYHHHSHQQEQCQQLAEISSMFQQLSAKNPLIFVIQLNITTTATTSNMNKTFMSMYLICGLWQMIWLLEKVFVICFHISRRAVALKKV